MRKGMACAAVLFLLAIIMFGGCGEKEEATGDAANVIRGEKQLSVREINSIKFEKPEEGFNVSNVFYDFMDDRVWMFRLEKQEGDESAEEQRVCVQIYDSTKKKVERNVLTPEIPGHEGAWICSAGLTDQGEISFKVWERKGEENFYFLVKTDVQGKVLEVTEPFPEEGDYPWNVDMFSESRRFHLQDGSTVISRWDEAARTSVLTWFGGEKAGQELGRLAGEMPGALCLGEEGVLYCLAGDSLLRWDTEKKLQEELFCLHENGVISSADSGLFLADNGDLVLCRINEGEALAYVLTDEEIVYDQKLRFSWLVELGEPTRYFSKCAGNYARETGGLPVILEKEQEKYYADYRNRIFAELAAGKGPDIMYLTREDLQLLAEKGVLCDLSGMIPEEVKAVMIPAALELGVVDGTMVGFTPQVEFLSLITADRIWAEESWTLDKFLETAESVKDWEIMIWYLGSDLCGPMFLDLLMSDTENTSLLDLERGVSYLNGDKFVRILELCKKRSQSTAETGRAEFVDLMKAGKGMAEWRWISDLSSFSGVMTGYGEDCNLVGYPAESGSGNYARAGYPYGCLAVNANSEHKEEIGKFFAYLLDYDKQFAVDTCSVRTDVIRDSLIYDEMSGYRMRISDNPDHMTVRQLDVKEDGSTWLEEYLEFVENCRPQPFMPPQISEIIAEEVAAYFKGDKSAEETADIIHRRVQLFLDENR